MEMNSLVVAQNEGRPLVSSRFTTGVGPSTRHAEEIFRRMKRLSAILTLISFLALVPLVAEDAIAESKVFDLCANAEDPYSATALDLNRKSEISSPVFD